MLPTKVFIWLTCLSLVFSVGVLGQACSYFPADCPTSQLADSADRFNNPIVPEEVSMEIRMHDFLSDLMQALADKKKWQVYQYNETHNTGYLNASRTGALDFKLRPPHEYEISFILIVNSDSLQAWQTWQRDFTQALVAEADKVNQNTENYATYTATMTKLQESQKIITERFRNASMIRVKYVLNSTDGATLSTIQDNMHHSGLIHVAHTALAEQAHNDKTDEQGGFDLDQFTRCDDLVFLLFGNWDIKPNGYRYYHAAYYNDKKNVDLVTPKNVTSDKIRTIVMHVEGAPAYLNQFLQSLDTEKLSQVITQ
jgi:hypothetical protein